MVHDALPQSVELDERELVILGIACRRSDDLAALERQLAKDGVTVTGSRGQTVIHPALIEVRQLSLAVSKLLGELELEDTANRPASAKSKQGSRAASIRWANERRRKAQEADRRGSQS